MGEWKDGILSSKVGNHRTLQERNRQLASPLHRLVWSFSFSFALRRFLLLLLHSLSLSLPGRFCLLLSSSHSLCFALTDGARSPVTLCTPRESHFQSDLACLALLSFFPPHSRSPRIEFIPPLSSPPRLCTLDLLLSDLCWLWNSFHSSLLTVD